MKNSKESIWKICILQRRHIFISIPMISATRNSVGPNHEVSLLEAVTATAAT